MDFWNVEVLNWFHQLLIETTLSHSWLDHSKSRFELELIMKLQVTVRQQSILMVQREKAFQVQLLPPAIKLTRELSLTPTHNPQVCTKHLWDCPKQTRGGGTPLSEGTIPCVHSLLLTSLSPERWGGKLNNNKFLKPRASHRKALQVSYQQEHLEIGEQRAREYKSWEKHKSWR